MSSDTYALLRTPFTAAEVKATLLHDPELADLGLTDHGEQAWIGGNRVSLVVKPWEWDEDELEVIPGGFAMAEVTVVLTPGRGPEGWGAMARVIAAILRLVPGDVCLADSEAAGPDLLRLGGVVYVNPNGFRPDNLPRFGYHPERIVEGIPPGLVAGTAAAAA